MNGSFAARSSRTTFLTPQSALDRKTAKLHFIQPIFDAYIGFAALVYRRNLRLMYVELHSCSAFSFLEGASLPEDLVSEAARLELPAIALLDRDGVNSRRAASLTKSSGRDRKSTRLNSSHLGI